MSGSPGYAFVDGLWPKLSRNAAPATLRSACVATRKLSTYRRKRDFTKTAEPSGTLPVKPSQAAALRHPEARGAPAALRPAPRARRRVQVLGGDARPFARLRRTSASPWKSRIIRSTTATSKARSRRASTAAARCSCGIAATGSRWAIARPKQQLQQGRAEIHARRRAPARQLGARAHEERSRRRQAHELAADQASRRIRARRGGRRRNCSTRIARSPPAARWRTSPPARAARRNRSCSTRASSRAPTRSGTRSARHAAASVAEARSRKRRQIAARARCRTSSSPSCASSSSARRAATAGAHEVKFDGYRMQLRVAGGEATLKTRKGLDWTDKFQPIAAAAAATSRLHHRRRSRRARSTNGAPDFAALQAALSDGDADDLIFFAFDLLFSTDDDLRTHAAARAQGAAEEAARVATVAREQPDPLRRSLRNRRRCGAANRRAA